MAKTTKTYSINDKTYELFDRICKKDNINKSSFIESKIKEYLSENLGYNDDDLYQSRMDEEYIVSIIGSDDTFLELSDGSRVSKIMFYHNFKGYKAVDPEKFFSGGLKFVSETLKEPNEEANVKYWENHRKEYPGIYDMTDEEEKIRRDNIKDIVEMNKKSEVIVDIDEKRELDKKILRRLDELKKQSNYTPDKDRITTDKYFNNGPESIKRYTGSLISDKQKLKLSNDLEKYRSTIKKLTKKQNTEDTLFGLRELSRNFKKYITENGYIMQHEFDENLTISKDIRLLIDIDNKGLMNEEILYRLKSITKS